MKIFNKSINRLAILKFYIKYVKFGMLLITILSFITGLLESIGVSMLFPILQEVLKDNNSVSKASFPIISDIISFLGFDYTINNLVTVFIVLFLFKAFFKFLTGYCKLHYSSKFLLDVRKRMLNLLSDLDYLNYTSRDSGKLSSTFTLEVENMVSGFIYFTNYLVTIISGFSFILIILFIDYRFALVIIAFGSIYYIGFKKVNIKIKDISKQITYNNSKFNSLLIQYIQSFKYLKSTNNSYFLNGFLRGTVNSIRKLKIQKDIRTNIVSTIQEPAVLIIVLFVVYISINYINIKTSLVFMLLVLFYRSTNYFLSSQSIWNNFLSQIGSTNSVIDLESSLKNNQEVDNGKSEVIFDKEIKLCNVSFKYNPKSNNSVLKNVSLFIPKKATVAFVGKSGSGKSTLINLITGILKPTDGHIEVDIENLNNISLKKWRSSIGYITQESVIFNDTILNNITSWNYNPSIDRDRLWEVIKVSQLDQLIQSEVDLYKEVGDRGVSLSGGQRQRIAIARELYRNPKILILDEATSSLDSETEYNIIQNIEKLKGKITIIIIAHRLSTIKFADLIYVIEDKTIVEKGSYEELSQKGNSKFNYFLKIQQFDS